MAVTVRIPTPLRKHTNGNDTVELAGSTVGEVIGNLRSEFPSLAEQICDDKGNVRRFVNLFANDEDIRFLDELDTEVDDGDEVGIVPAIAGGLRA